MKRKLFSVLTAVLICASFANAQTSTKPFSFQGYAIDPDGKTIGSTGITVKFTLTATGGTYTEEVPRTTDAFGVFTATIGEVDATAFSKLDFTKKADDYNLKVEVKKTSGGAYTTISNTPMKAVPYARMAENGVPVGTIVAYGGDKNNVPAGWFLCDGTSYSQTTYPQLYAVIGSAWGTTGSSFNVPDLRGRFLRGVDEAAGRDPDKATRTASNTGGNTGNLVGSVQGDDNRSHNHGAAGTTTTNGNHSHNYTDPTIGSFSLASDANGTTKEYATVNAGTTTSNGNHTHTFSFTTGNSGGEARPKNAGVYYIIKY